MVMPATLRVTHQADFGFELRRGRFDVVLDDKVVGSVELHETMKVQVEPGGHSVEMRKGRYRSRDESFAAADGEVVKFRCYGTRIWPLYAASFVVPRLAISLSRE
jgi:hypothetical protein